MSAHRTNSRQSTPAGLVFCEKLVSDVDHVATGARARAQRTNAGITLRELSVVMGISATYLSDLERGRRTWNERVWQNFQTALRQGKRVNPGRKGGNRGQ